MSPHKPETGDIAETADQLLGYSAGKDCYGVVGNPIEHSLSPVLHTAFAQQFNEKIHYGRLLLTAECFDSEIRAFFQQGGCGLNVTVPFKERAFQMCDQLTDNARVAGAVNTLWCEGSLIWGDNTDGRGLVLDLQGRCGCSLVDKKVLMLGAGGAVKGVMAPLLEAGVCHITVANRTRAKADLLVEQFYQDDSTVSIEAIDAGAVASFSGFDLVIQGTGAGLSQAVPTLNEDWFSSETVCYDMMYGDVPTSFLEVVRDRFGVSARWDGLGMLLEQAALAYARWRGHSPATAAVMARLRPH
jgi:shikimate dehydrogenase